MKTIFIPGFKCKYKGPFEVFNPTWSKSPSYWVKEFEQFVKDKKDYTAVGFSMGAYILACAKVKPKKTIYCSMSPFFKSDIKYWDKKWLKFLGKRFNDLGKYHKKPNSTFLVGEFEMPLMMRVKRFGKVKIIKGVGHDFNNPKYQKAVNNIVKPK